MGAWPGLAETPIILDTLNDYREMKLELHAHCSCCGAHRQLDLDTLMRRFGHHKPVDALARRFKCADCRQRRCICGGRKTGLLVHGPADSVLRGHWHYQGDTRFPWMDPRTATRRRLRVGRVE